MNWQEQINKLNNLTSKFVNEYDNFNKHTNLIKHLDKFNKLCNGYFELDNIDLNLMNKTNKISQTNQTSQTNSNLIGNKKIKRKHLLKLIHPDKLSGTINRIKNKLIKTNQEQILNFDDEENKIKLCVTKIISDKLDIFNCFRLLKKNINILIFDNLCLLLKLDTEQIDLVDSNIYEIKEKKFESNFSPDIIKFVNTFNNMCILKSPPHQISQIFVSINDLIKIFIEDNIFKKMYHVTMILNDLEEEKKLINIKLDGEMNANDKYYKFESNYKLESNYLKESNDKIINLLKNLKEIEESILMYREENIHYINIISNISNITVGNIIHDLAFLNDKNKLMYLYFNELKKDLAYLHEYICSRNIVKITDRYYYVPPIDKSISLELANLEISKIKFSI